MFIPTGPGCSQGRGQASSFRPRPGARSQPRRGWSVFWTWGSGSWHGKNLENPRKNHGKPVEFRDQTWKKPGLSSWNIQQNGFDQRKTKFEMVWFDRKRCWRWWWFFHHQQEDLISLVTKKGECNSKNKDWTHKHVRWTWFKPKQPHETWNVKHYT